MSDLLPIELWKSAVMSPKETFAKEKANASLAEGAKQLAVGGAIAGVLGGLLTFNPLAIVGMAIGYAIFVPISSLVFNGVFWVLAKLLGGKGSYSAQYYVDALFTAPLMPIAAIPLVGLLASFYSIYLYVLAIREVHELSTGKAIAVVAIPIVIAIIIAVLAIGAVIAMLGAAGLSGLESLQGA